MYVLFQIHIKIGILTISVLVIPKLRLVGIGIIEMIYSADSLTGNLRNPNSLVSEEN